VRLRPQPSRPCVVAGRDVVQQRLRVLDEPRRRQPLLAGNPLLELGRAEVAEDELVVVAREAERELEVALGDAQRSNRAACPCPTPTPRRRLRCR
jgi:hypothetical protein